MGLANDEPLLRLTWTDTITGRHGYLVVHSLVSGIATGGTRMREGCTLREVEDLARGMATKAAVFDLPVGGAKGGIDCDPHDPGAQGMLRRFLTAMRPWLEAHWVTAEDLGVPQELIDEVFADLGLGQSYHAAISRSTDAAATLRRVKAGLASPVPGGYALGDVVGGYGVAQACLGAIEGWARQPREATVAIQGVGTMGGGAAWYLHEAGMRVVAVADALGALYDPSGLDVPALLAARNRFGEIDRSQVPAGVRALPREAVRTVAADIFVPAATSYAITEENADEIDVKLVVEAANVATTTEAEEILATKGIPVIPDFVANAAAAAWAWWLLLGRVGSDPVDSFALIQNEMRSRVRPLVHAWDVDRERPRVTALHFADTHRMRYQQAERTGPLPLLIPC